MSDDNKKPVISDGISRRTFLHGIAGAAAQVSAFSVLAACSSDAEGNPIVSPDAGSVSPDADSPDGSPGGPVSPDGGSPGSPDGSPSGSDAGTSDSGGPSAGQGTLADVKHVVVLMQENRSFDHYFGTMRGVRGFSDRTAVQLASGLSVFYQPDSARTDGQFLLPFQVDTKVVDGQRIKDLGHGWNDQHQAVADGAVDGWVAAKGELTMAYYADTDVPFHRALADAFTICDHYYCSVLGPTTPNRLHLFTGMVDADAKGGGPVISNPDDYNPVFTWKTYPERLQEQGISWRVYANHEVGDDGDHPFVGDYGDNPLWLFQAYHDALKDPATRDLADRAAVLDSWEPDSGQGKDTQHVLAEFISDCQAGKLPQVSWIVGPYGYSEHPTARPVDGAAYMQAVLNALWANPELWASTVLIVNYDENDGFFDHVPPPIAPVGTAGETVGDKTIGLGPRVPLMVISPWSRGGWVSSQVFDHTSVIRFLETYTGVKEPNISDWRRSISGDLTNCFDFKKKDTSIPTLPDTAALRQQADQTQDSLGPPTTPPAGSQTMPEQEPGTRKARPLPYQPIAAASIDATKAAVGLTMTNAGSVTLQLLAIDWLNLTTPNRYDVPPQGKASASIPVTDKNHMYALTVYGPNRFLAHFAGDLTKPGAGVEIAPSIAGDASAPKLAFTLTNGTQATVTFTVKATQYRTDGPRAFPVEAGKTVTATFDPLGSANGWYDLEISLNSDPSFLRRFSGHLENGAESVTG
ncbi:MAG TPA: phospholipase C, phosphocholine-specific [Polyangiaceae bacterium]|nr:phospholipase C, phosphocholine-specific [Polyangiaceae bacterium]